MVLCSFIPPNFLGLSQPFQRYELPRGLWVRRLWNRRPGPVENAGNGLRKAVNTPPVRDQSHRPGDAGARVHDPQGGTRLPGPRRRAGPRICQQEGRWGDTRAFRFWLPLRNINPVFLKSEVSLFL
jgi:hypothetical protein